MGDPVNLALRREHYRRPFAHETDRPRTGDIAELKRDHCQSETGLLVQVMGDPHLMSGRCHKCGERIDEWMVEIFTQHPAWFGTPGPWFYPVSWLKRIDPRDPVYFERIRQYIPNPALSWFK